MRTRLNTIQSKDARNRKLKVKRMLRNPKYPLRNNKKTIRKLPKTPFINSKEEPYGIKKHTENAKKP